MRTIIAVDPGSHKTGIAVVQENLEALAKKIIPTEQLVKEVEFLYMMYNKEVRTPIEAIVCGNGTHHQTLYPMIQELATRLETTTFLVKEAYTTEEGRKRYWQCNPPKGLKRLIPIGFQVPPVPVDDYTAWIIGERYFNGDIE